MDGHRGGVSKQDLLGLLGLIGTLGARLACFRLRSKKVVLEFLIFIHPATRKRRISAV